MSDLYLPVSFLPGAAGRFANVAFRMLGLAPLHPIYDYRRALAGCHLRYLSSVSFRLFGFGPVAYETLTATRMA